jgi:hypothetical protein
MIIINAMPLGFVEKQVVGEEKRIFGKTKTALNQNALVGIVLQHSCKGQLPRHFCA